MSRPLWILLACLLLTGPLWAQTKHDTNAAVSTSAAFAEVLLRKTELLAEAESLSADYTDISPKMVDLRYEIGILERYVSRLTAVPAAEAGRLTAALGKLIVRRASLDAELSRLSRTLNVEHPDHKRAKKKLEVFDAAIKQILP